MTLKSGTNLGLLVSGAAGEAYYAELLRQWRGLDALIQPSVIARVASVPTTGMVDGDRYLLTTAPNANTIARYALDSQSVNGAWEYFMPNDGWHVWSTADQVSYRFKGGAWAADSAGGTSGGTVQPQSIVVACSDETTALVAGTGKVTFRMPYGFTLTSVRASLTTAQQTGALLSVDIKAGAGGSVLSTKLTFDNASKTSVGATTPAVIKTASLADDAEVTVDILAIGDGTAKGLKVTLIGTPT